MVSPEFARNTIEALERLQTDLTALTNSQSQNREDSDKAIKDMKAYVDGMLGHHAGIKSVDSKRKFDTKNLKLNPWDGEPKTFKTYEYHLKEFIKRESMELANAMTKAEMSREPTGIDFEGIDKYLDNELRWILVNYTSGDAETTVRRLSNRTGLETWRLLKMMSNLGVAPRKPLTYRN